MKMNSARKATPPALRKTSTGITGFDEITAGGLPKGRPTLICGSAGCGKTLFSIEFLVRRRFAHPRQERRKYVRKPPPSGADASDRNNSRPPDEHRHTLLRAETRLAQVNVVAQDSKGNAITALTRDDFTLFDNGKKIPIDEFSAVSIATQPNAPTLAPRTFTNRVGLPSATVILLDGLNTAVEDQTWARAEVISFLEKLEPQDRVAIFLLGDHLMVLQNFTSDPKVLLAVLKNTKPRAPQELGASAPPAPTPGSAKQVDLETALAQLGGATGAGSGATGPNTTGIGAAAASNAQAQEEAVMIQFEQHQASFFVMDREGRTVAKGRRADGLDMDVVAARHEHDEPRRAPGRDVGGHRIVQAGQGVSRERTAGCRCHAV